MCSNFFVEKSYNLWEDAEKYSRARQVTADSIIPGLHIAYSITKATDTQSEYVTLIALPRQQWLRERASILGLYCIATLISYSARR